ncbi:sphingosine 1-phosphate receptor 5-like [Lampetra fluviatilis]
MRPLMANLALTDLLAGLCFLANVHLSGGRTLTLTRGRWFAREGAVFVALAASVMGMGAIALERHLGTGQLHRYSPSPRRLFTLLVCGWLLSALLGALPALGWNCVGALPSCSTLLPLYARSYLLFSVALLTAIVVVMLASYGAVFTRACRGRVHRRRACGLTRGALLTAIVVVMLASYGAVFTRACRGRVHRRRACGLTRGPRVGTLSLLGTLLSLIGVFILCWCPLFALLLMDALCTGTAERRHQRCPQLYQAQRSADTRDAPSSTR